MAETLTAQLALELGGFTAGLQSAAQAFRQFTSDLTNQIQQLANAFSPLQKAVEDTSKARIQATKAAADTTTAIEKQLQRDLEAAQRASIKLQTDLDLERLKTRQQNEKVASEALTSLYRNFFNVSLGLYKERIAQEKALLDAETEQVRATLAAQLRLRREHEAQLESERRLRNNQLRAELTNVRAGAPVPGAQPGAAPVGSQAPFQLAQIQGYLNLLQEAGAEHGRFSQGLLAVAGVFGVVGSAIDITLRAVQAFLRHLREVATESVNTAIKFQSLQAVFNGTSGGARQGGEAFAFVRDQASRLGVNFESLAVSYKNFNAASSALNIETKESREIFLAFANAARALGLSSDQLQHILVAVEQIMSKGKVSAEELRRQLGNSLPGAFAIAARSIGVTTSELDSMLKKGELLSQDFILPFAREVQRTFGSLVPEQTRTAQAAFERFYNEIKFLQVEFGESILSVFKPVLDTVNKILEGYRKIREEREKDRPPKLSPVQGENLGKVQDDINVTTELINTLNDKLFRLRELQAGSRGNLDFDKLADLLPQKIGGGNRFIPDLDLTPLRDLIKNQGISVGIAETEKEVTRLNNSLKQLLITKERLEALQQDTGTPVIGPISFTKEVEAIDKELKTLEESLAIIDRRIKEFDVSGVTALKDEFGDTTELVKNLEATLTIQREKYKEIEAAAQKITETIQGSKGLQEAVTPEIQKQIEKVRTQLATGALRIQQLELEIEKQKDIGKALEEGDKQRRAGIEKRQRDIEKAIEEEVREEEKGNKEKLRILKDYADANLDIEKAITLATSKETRSRVDDLKAKLEEEVKYYTDRRVEQSQIDRLVAARTAEIQRVGTEELEQQLKKQQQLLKEQEKPWTELGNRIESILAGTFERILQGTTNILDGIKDAFIKLLARLAAEAAAAQIVIGIKAVVGGSLGGGAASLASTIFGVSGVGGAGAVDTAGIVGGGGGGGSSTGQLLSTGSNIVSLGSGLTGNSATGSVINLLGGSSLLSTPLFGTGAGTLATAGTGSLASLGASAPVAFYGSGSGATAIAGGGAAAAAPASSAAVTGGTLLTGAGVGIAAGLLISQLLEAVGFGGTGNSVLSGAAGGAIAGTIIAPGIGTAIGAGIGALGGYIASLFGGGKRKPQIDIQNVEGGPVSFNETLGGLTFDPFRITNAPFRDIGQILPNVGNKPHQTTYSNFIAAIGDAANQYFGSVIDGFRSLQPQVQKALVSPLNDIGEQIRQNLEQTKFEGNDALQQLQDYFSTKLPEFTQNLLRPLTEGLDKIDPYIRAFNEAIGRGQEILARLTQEQQQIKLQIQQQIHGLEEGLFTPAQLFVRRRNEFTDARKFLETATPQQKIATIPLIQSLASDVFSLGRQEDVLGQDAPLVRNLQQDIIQVLRDLQSTTDTVYDEVKGQVQEQITLAEDQVNVLINSLGNVQSIDSAIASANDILGQINTAFSVIEDQDAVNNAVQLALLSGQLNTLSSIDSVSKEQLGVLRSISQNQGIAGATGGGFGGGDGGEGDGGFARGSGYIPYNMVAFLHQGEAVVPRHQNGQTTGAPIIINVNGTGDPDRVATQVVAKIERQILLGKTSIMGRKN